MADGKSNYRIDFILIPEDPYFTTSPYTIEIARRGTEPLTTEEGFAHPGKTTLPGAQVNVVKFKTTLLKKNESKAELPVSDHYGLEATLEIRKRRD